MVKASPVQSPGLMKNCGVLCQPFNKHVPYGTHDATSSR